MPAVTFIYQMVVTSVYQMHVDLMVDNQQVQGEQIMLVWCHVVMLARICLRSASFDQAPQTRLSRSC